MDSLVKAFSCSLSLNENLFTAAFGTVPTAQPQRRKPPRFLRPKLPANTKAALSRQVQKSQPSLGRILPQLKEMLAEPVECSAEFVPFKLCCS
jgi:hypothetical protein